MEDGGEDVWRGDVRGWEEIGEDGRDNEDKNGEDV